MYINISYEDCRCNVVSIEPCLTHSQYKYTHILPLILFLLEVYILKDILSINYYYRRSFRRNFYWIVSIFLLFCLFRTIYVSGDHYSLTALLLRSNIIYCNERFKIIDEIISFSRETICFINVDFLLL